MSKALFVQLLRSIKSLPMSQAGWIVLIEGVDEKPDWLVGCPIARLSNGENLGLGYDCQPYNGWKVEYMDGKCVVVYEDQEGQS